MLKSHVTFGRRGQRAQFERAVVSRLERAAQMASHNAAADARDEIRTDMKAARLGGLSNAIGTGSDLKRGRIHRTGGGFSASGYVFARGRSERTKGAIAAYTEGAQITPRRSRWLWIATSDIPKRAGRYRMTPALYRKTGLEQKIGPLVQVPGRNRNEALLVVQSVTLDRFGRAGSARRLPKRGRIGTRRTGEVSIVAFVGIKRTARAVRVSPRTIVAKHAQRLPALIAEALARSGR